MVDTDTFGTDRSVLEKLRAEVVREGSMSYFVEYEDGAQRVEPKNEKHRVLFESDILDVEDDADPTTFSAVGTALTSEDDTSGARVGFEADLVTDDYELSVDDESIFLDGSDAFEVLSMVIDGIVDTTDRTPWMDAVLVYEIAPAVADDLHDRFYELLRDRVRPDRLTPFSSDKGWIEVTNDGWIVSDTFRVTYDAEVYLEDDVEAYEVNGNSVTPVDRDGRFMQASFDTDETCLIEIDGEQVTLTEKEQRFLALVQVLSDPNTYLGVEGSGLRSAIERATFGDDELDRIASTIHVRWWKDPTSGLVHEHELDKHVLRVNFDIREWVIDEHINRFSEYDHGAVHELLAQEDVIRADDRRTFHGFVDPDDEDIDAQWDHIRDIADDALVPDWVHRELEALYGGD